MVANTKAKVLRSTNRLMFVLLGFLAPTQGTSDHAIASPVVASNFTYSGRLAQGNGAPVEGPIDVQINFYSTAVDGTPLGASPYLFSAVKLEDGQFQIVIPLTGSDVSAIFPETGADTFIEVTNATDRKTYPRQRFSVVPYALKVPVDGRTLAFDGNGQLAVKDLAVTKITGLAEALSNKVAVNQALVGDVTGTFSANVVSKLRGQDVSTTAPNSGEVLTFVDGKWTPQSLGTLSVGTVTSVHVEPPMAITDPSTSPKLILTAANGVASGYLSSADWLTFNSKQDFLGYSPLNQAGGTMTGTLNMGGKRLTNLPAPVAASDAVTKLYADATLLHRDGSVALSGPWAVGDDLTNVGNINLSTQKTLGLGTYDADAEAILVASLKEDDQGKTWFSSAASEIKYWDGHSAKSIGVALTGVMRLNGQGGNDQTLTKPGTTGIDPNWISDSNTHTLQIPLALNSGVTAGLISNAEYTTFQNKVNIAGDTMTGMLALPANALIAGDKQLVLANGNVGIGTISPAATLEVNGSVKITGGYPGSGKVLTSDANGLSYWSTPLPGTVTSVGITAPAEGITVSAGSPVTSSGDIALVLANDLNAVENLSGTGIVKRTATDTWTTIADHSDDWDSAYIDRLKWDGGGTGLVAETGRSSLGLGALSTLSTVTSAEITDGSVVNADISGSASIVDTKLATISTPGKVSGSSMTSGTISGSTSINTSGSIVTSGNVGIGVSNPTSKLQVSGQAASGYANTSSATIDWNSGNIQSTTAAAGTITMTNMVDGAGYTLILNNTSGGSYSLAATGLTFRCSPACPVTVTAGSDSVIAMVKGGSTVWVGWTKGYQ